MQNIKGATNSYTYKNVCKIVTAFSNFTFLFTSDLEALSGV